MSELIAPAAGTYDVNPEYLQDNYCCVTVSVNGKPVGNEICAGINFGTKATKINTVLSCGQGGVFV